MMMHHRLASLSPWELLCDLFPLELSAWGWSLHCVTKIPSLFLPFACFPSFHQSDPVLQRCILPALLPLFHEVHLQLTDQLHNLRFFNSRYIHNLQFFLADDLDTDPLFFQMTRHLRAGAIARSSRFFPQYLPADSGICSLFGKCFSDKTKVTVLNYLNVSANANKSWVHSALRSKGQNWIMQSSFWSFGINYNWAFQLSESCLMNFLR